MPKTPKQQVTDYEKATTAFKNKSEKYRKELAADRKKLRKEYEGWVASMKAPAFMGLLDTKTKNALTKTHQEANRLTKPKPRKKKDDEKK